jgi:hypothetical protein
LSVIGVFRGPREPSAVKGFDWLDPVKGVGVDTDTQNSEQPAAPYYMMSEGNTIRTHINVDTMSQIMLRNLYFLTSNFIN